MNDNMKKGKKAEAIIADLFKEAGFKVIKYGYEHTVKELADKNNLIKGMAGQYIRHQPDFIVVNKQNEAFFVEVKHRSNYFFPTKELFPYPCCYVILLSKQNIIAQNVSILFQKKAGFLPLKRMEPFKNIPNNIIEKYVLKLRRTLGDETLTGQFVEKYVKKITGKNLQQPTDTIKIDAPVITKTTPKPTIIQKPSSPPKSKPSPGVKPKNTGYTGSRTPRRPSTRRPTRSRTPRRPSTRRPAGGRKKPISRKPYGKKTSRPTSSGRNQRGRSIKRPRSASGRSKPRTKRRY
jgi:hypothetical protein